MLRTESVPKSIPTTKLSASLTTSPPREWLADPDGLESLATVNVPHAQSQAADQAVQAAVAVAASHPPSPARSWGGSDAGYRVRHRRTVPSGSRRRGFLTRRLSRGEGE